MANTFNNWFGGDGGGNDKKSIAKCNNVSQLLKGLNDDMNEILSIENSMSISSNSNNISGMVNEVNEGISLTSKDKRSDITGAEEEENQQDRSLSKNENEDSSKTRLIERYELLECRLRRIKNILYSDTENSLSTTTTIDDVNASDKNEQQHLQKNLSQQECPKSFSILVDEITQKYSKLIPQLFTQMPKEEMPFESRKDIAAIFNALMVRRYLPSLLSITGDKNNTGQSHPQSHNQFAIYILNHYDEIMKPLLEGHNRTNTAIDCALNCGSALRSTLRHEVLYKKLLLNHSNTQKYVYPLLDTYVHLPNFEVASDVLATVRDIFLTDRSITAQFLEREYDPIFSVTTTLEGQTNRKTKQKSYFHKMLQSQNYITRRLSLKLLGEILLDRMNFGIMMKFISQVRNLQIIMTLLSDSYGNIQYEAFHVFKIFVANPNKPDSILKVLKDNKVKLMKYLEQFHIQREKEDEQFRDEKRLILNTLDGL